MTAGEAVRESVGRLTRRPGGEIRDEQRLSEDLNLRSLARVELAVLLEERLHRPVKDAIVQRARTVADLIAAVSP